MPDGRRPNALAMTRLREEFGGCCSAKTWLTIVQLTRSFECRQAVRGRRGSSTTPCRNRRRREPHRDRSSRRIIPGFCRCRRLDREPTARGAEGFPWHRPEAAVMPAVMRAIKRTGRRVSMKYLDYGEDGRGVSNRKPPSCRSAFAPGPERNTIISAPARSTGP